MRFVKPDVVVRYYLQSDPKDWVELKKELTVGEDKRYRTRGLKSMSGLGAKKDSTDESGKDIKVDVDWDVLPFSRVEAYLVNWSDNREPSRSAIEGLCKEDFEEIDKVVLNHIELMEAEKKVKTGTETPPPPSL